MTILPWNRHISLVRSERRVRPHARTIYPEPRSAIGDSTEVKALKMIYESTATLFDLMRLEVNSEIKFDLSVSNWNIDERNIKGRRLTSFRTIHHHNHKHNNNPRIVNYSLNRLFHFKITL
jgi:hypothetical protein